MVIIEGPDGAGKSTLVRQLQETFPNLHELQRGEREKLGESPNQKAILYHALGLSIATTNVAQIADRLFVSELVYGPIWRDENVFADDQDVIRNFLRLCRIPIIFCLPVQSTCRRNILQGQQLEKVLPTLPKVYSAYQYQFELFKRNGCNVLYYDYEVDALSRPETAVREYLNHKEKRVHQDSKQEVL